MDPISAYIATFPQPIQEKLNALRTLITGLAPEATEKIAYQMPTFYLKGNLVHFAAFKNHIGFYPTPSGITGFETALKPYKTSKGAIQFSLDHPLPLDLVTDIVLTRLSENTQTPYYWLDHYTLRLLGVEKDYKEEWGATRYMIDGKMFMMCGGDKDGTPIITLKGDPEEAPMLRGAYSDIIPGYYMNKEHWNSVYVGGAVPDYLLRSLVDTAHGLIFKSLTKKRQEALRLLESMGQ